MYKNVHFYKEQWDEEFSIAFKLVEELYKAYPDSNKQITDIANSIANNSLSQEVLNKIQKIFQKDIYKCERNINDLTPDAPILDPIPQKTLKSLQMQIERKEMILSLSKQLLSKIGEQHLNHKRLAM